MNPRETRIRVWSYEPNLTLQDLEDMKEGMLECPLCGSVYLKKRGHNEAICLMAQAMGRGR